MHFSLVKMNPIDASPSHGFDDAIFPLYFSLKRLGFCVEILFNHTNPDSRNIIFGSCIAPRRISRNIPADSIIFNLEQIQDGNSWCNHNYLSHLRNFEVWDYSEKNIQSLKERNIPALHVPLGYVQEMSRLTLQKKTEADILFYGLISDRRDAIIRGLVNSGVHVLATQNAFGSLRDQLLTKTKAVLNIHNHLPAKLEVVRLGYLWANKIPVISERRDDTSLPEHLEEACFYTTYETLIEKIQQVICDKKQLTQQGIKGYRAFASKPMEDSLAFFLGRKSHSFAMRGQLNSKPKVDSSFQQSSSKNSSLLPEWLIKEDSMP